MNHLCTFPSTPRICLKLPLTLSPHIHVYWGLGLHKLSVGPVLTHLRVPKNNCSGWYAKTLEYGGPKMI